MVDFALVQAAAEAIRPHLDILLPSDSAATMDRQTDKLLQAAESGRDVSEELLAVLNSTAATRDFTRDFLDERTSDDVQDRDVPTRRGRRPPGSPAVAATRWVCPHGDYDWFQVTKADRPGTCPVHDVPLVRA